MNESVVSERRRHPRFPGAHAAKVYLPRALRFAGAETADLSVGGALLRVDRSRPIAAGDEIEVAIAHGEECVAPAALLRRARVVRVSAMDHYHQAVAVEFADSGTLSAAA
ncbi:MAG: PilZ domain-containing protein [Phycisphaerales bacterium]|nr:PilZ domain-containing protein [Phycisphaerales bacterium]